MHLFLIGGGEIGAPKTDGTHRPLTTLPLDEHFVASIGKSHPTLLFIPTACEPFDPTHTYEQGMQDLYGKKLGCKVETLYLNQTPFADMQNCLAKADVLYIGGGNTEYMMKRWTETGLDKELKKEALSGKPIAGISAGAMCWFDKVYIGEGKETTYTAGLGLFPNACMPHWNKHKHFIQTSIAKVFPFVAIDENVAVEVKGKEMSLITSAPNVGAFFCQFNPDFSQRPLQARDLRLSPLFHKERTHE